MGTPAPCPLPPNASAKQIAERDEEDKNHIAALIMAGLVLCAGIVVFLVITLLAIGGLKLVAQAACIAGLVAIGLVYGFRYIRARL